MNYSEMNIDHKVGKSTIWTERVVPTPDGDVFFMALYRKVSNKYSGEYPSYISTDIRKRSRKELATILNNLRKDHG